MNHKLQADLQVALQFIPLGSDRMSPSCATLPAILKDEVIRPEGLKVEETAGLLK